MPVDPAQVALEEAREAGPVHVGHQRWHQLGLEAMLRRAGLAEWARVLSEVMTLHRLLYPLSEQAPPDWLRRTAVGDILGTAFSTRTEDALYRHLDTLHPHREQIARELAEREKPLFNLDETLSLYDLTSTSFEGQAVRNRQAKRGYSRDKRPDCQPVLVGLVRDGDGFPKAHEICAGNRQDRSTVVSFR
jgi:transposase